MNRIETLAKYKMVLNTSVANDNRQETVSALAHADLFYFLVFVLHREDANCDWVYYRCREYQSAPDGYMDLWAREHYKSTIITFAGILWHLMTYPERTYAIISQSKKVADAFVFQIKTELETNLALQKIAADVFWEDPKKNAELWSMKNGLIIRRKTNPKEPTLIGYGLVEGQPAGPHHTDLHYEDIVNRDAVRTTDAIATNEEMFRLSLNLGTRDGRKRLAGTYWHYNDTHISIKKAGTFIPRLYPATTNGREDGVPVLLTREALAQKVRDMGPYISGCLCVGSRVLMSDWSYKNIEEIRPGHEVIGFTIPETSKKSALIKTKVLAVRVRQAIANRYTLESGEYVDCTPDHHWWTARREERRKKYATLEESREGLVRITDEERCPHPFAAAWLGGMIDGEGSINVNGKQITVYQSEEHNPEVVRRLRSALKSLGIEWRETLRPAREGHKESSAFNLLGGRAMRHKLLRWCRPAKAEQLEQTMYGTRIRPTNTKDKVASTTPLGLRDVWALQTESGNYIANGYASKNCQLFLNPTQDSLIQFKEEWLHYWRAQRTVGLNLYLICDPAGSKKKDSDYTVFMIVGLGSDRNYYVVDWVRDRLSLTERSNVLFKWHQLYKPINVGYEKYGKDSDIEHFEDRMERDNYRFGIQELKGPLAKIERINRLIPYFKQGRVFIPAKSPYIQYDGATVDLTQSFIQDEYLAHPFEVHDDMLDDLARILDEDLGATFPQGSEVDPLRIGEPSAAEEYDPLRWGQ